jgi:hypothetical protein
MPKEAFAYMWYTIQNNQTWEGEVKNLKKDGGHYWVYAIVTPDYDYNGNCIGYTSIRRDIAMQKEVEILNTSLEMKVEEANKEVRTQMERGVFDIDSIKKANQTLIDTLNDSLRIADEGKQARKEALVELDKTEKELKDALLSTKAKMAVSSDKLVKDINK